MTEDKRKFHRIPFTGGVVILHQTARHKATLVDLSLRGALTSQPQGWRPRVGEDCRLEILPEDADSPIHMEAQIAHVDRERVGFRCLHIDIDSISFLKRLVELNLGDPELLQRELSALG